MAVAALGGVWGRRLRTEHCAWVHVTEGALQLELAVQHGGQPADPFEDPLRCRVAERQPHLAAAQPVGVKRRIPQRGDYPSLGRKRLQ